MNLQSPSKYFPKFYHERMARISEHSLQPSAYDDIPFPDNVQISISEVAQQNPLIIIKNCTGKCISSHEAACFSCMHQGKNLALELLLSDRCFLPQRVVNANIKNLIKCIEFFGLSAHPHHKSLTNTLRKELDNVVFFSRAIAERNKLRQSSSLKDDATDDSICRTLEPTIVTTSCHKRLHESLVSCYSNEDLKSINPNLKLKIAEKQQSPTCCSKLTLNSHNDIEDNFFHFENLNEYCCCGMHQSETSQLHSNEMLYEVPIIEISENNEEDLILGLNQIGVVSNEIEPFESDLTMPIQLSSNNGDLAFDSLSFVTQDESMEMSHIDSFEDDINDFDGFVSCNSKEDTRVICKDFHHFIDKFKISGLLPLSLVEMIEKTLPELDFCFTGPSPILWFMHFLNAVSNLHASFDLREMDETFFIALNFSFSSNSIAFNAALPMNMFPKISLPQMQLELPYAYLNNSSIQECFLSLSSPNGISASVPHNWVNTYDREHMKSSQFMVVIPTAIIGMQGILKDAQDTGLVKIEKYTYKKKICKKISNAIESNLNLSGSKKCKKRLLNKKRIGNSTVRTRRNTLIKKLSHDKYIEKNLLIESISGKKPVIILHDCMKKNPSLKGFATSKKRAPPCSKNLKDLSYVIQQSESLPKELSENKVEEISPSNMKNEKLPKKELEGQFEQTAWSSLKNGALPKKELEVRGSSLKNGALPKKELEVRVEKLSLSISKKFQLPLDDQGRRKSREPTLDLGVALETSDNSDVISLDVGSGSDWEDHEESSRKLNAEKPLSAPRVNPKDANFDIEASNSPEKEIAGTITSRRLICAPKTLNSPVPSTPAHSSTASIGECSQRRMQSFYPRPRIQNGFCFKYFYESNCFKWKCSFSHKMPYKSLQLFLGDLILHYISCDNSQKAWELLFSHKKHFESQSDYMFLASVLKPLARVVVKGIGPSNFWVPKQFSNIFRLVKLEAHCEMGNTREAFIILSETMNYDESRETMKEQLLFTFIRYCERLPEFEATSPSEVVWKLHYDTLLPVSLAHQVKEDLDYHYILFYLKNGFLDKAECIYNLVVGKLSAADDPLYKRITSKYIAFMKNGGRHKEVTNVLSHVKKLKRFDPHLMYEIFLSIKEIKDHQIGLDFIEMVVKERLLFPLHQCCTIAELAFEIDNAAAMKLIPHFAKKTSYQPHVAQLLKLLDSFDSNSEAMWIQLHSVICCLRPESISKISSSLHKLVSSSPYFPTLDSILHECCIQGTNIEFASIKSEDPFTFCRPQLSGCAKNLKDAPSVSCNVDGELHSSFEYTEEYTYIESLSDDNDYSLERSQCLDPDSFCSPRNSCLGKTYEGQHKQDVLAIQDDTITGHSHCDISLESLASGSMNGSYSPLPKRNRIEDTITKDIFFPDQWHRKEFDAHNAGLSSHPLISPPISTSSISYNSPQFPSYHQQNSCPTVSGRVMRPGGSSVTGVNSHLEEASLKSYSKLSNSCRGHSIPFTKEQRTSNRLCGYKAASEIPTCRPHPESSIVKAVTALPLLA